MNVFPQNPMANGYPSKPSEEILDPLLPATLQVGWIVGATQLLAELACVAAAIATYLPEGMYGDVPFLVDYLHLWIYLAQGLFFVWKGRRWAAEWSNHKKPWWRLVIAVLGWPMHLTLVTFHQKVHQFDAQYPSHKMTTPWLREKLFFSLMRAAGFWFFGLAMATLIVIMLDQVLGIL